MRCLINLPLKSIIHGILWWQEKAALKSSSLFLLILWYENTHATQLPTRRRCTIFCLKSSFPKCLICILEIVPKRVICGAGGVGGGAISHFVRVDFISSHYYIERLGEEGRLIKLHIKV